MAGTPASLCFWAFSLFIFFVGGCTI
jgi:hypothetical protein